MQPHSTQIQPLPSSRSPSFVVQSHIRVKNREERRTQEQLELAPLSAASCKHNTSRDYWGATCDISMNLRTYACTRYVEPVHYYTSVDAWKRFETGSSRNGYEPFCSVDRPLDYLLIAASNAYELSSGTEATEPEQQISSPSHTPINGPSSHSSLPVRFARPVPYLLGLLSPWATAKLFTWG